MSERRATSDARRVADADFLGIARERVYSPGKVEADRAILDTVAERLRVAHRVEVVSADAPLPEVAPPTVVFAMCQGPAALDTLHRWQASNVRVINSAAAIANTHRRRMLAAFERAGVPHPESRLVDTAAPGTLPEWIDAGVWVKRGDVHATDPGDVVRVADRSAAVAALAALAERGIGTALLQRHIEGEVVKFYAVRRTFFAAFPSAGPVPSGLRRLAEAGGAALELEVFGGDCVRDRQDNLWLIDLNDWPSYGACRIGAAEAIASYLTGEAGEM